MYYSTRGIFLRKVKYADTSLIAGIYTEEFGLQSYIIKNLRSKGSKMSPGLLQPLSLLEMVVSHREKANLNHIREMRSAHQAETMLTDVRKGAITLFLNELLIKTIKEENKNPELFNFLFESIKLFDIMKSNISNFHLAFALKLTKYLGFFPQGAYSASNNNFDMEEGLFTTAPAIKTEIFISGEECEHFAIMLALPYDKIESHKLGQATRNSLLNKILLYYSLHIPTAANFKSHNILREVFKD